MSRFVALVVEDDPFQRECLADLLKGEGLEVLECANGEGRRNWSLLSTCPVLWALVTDANRGGEMSGVELAQYAWVPLAGLNVVNGPLDGPRSFFGTTPTFL